MNNQIVKPEGYEQLSAEEKEMVCSYVLTKITDAILKITDPRINKLQFLKNYIQKNIDDAVEEEDYFLAQFYRDIQLKSIELISKKETIK